MAHEPRDPQDARRSHDAPADNGTYVVTLVVTDKDGGATPTTSTLTVINLPPTITQFVVPATGKRPIVR